MDRAYKIFSRLGYNDLSYECKAVSDEIIQDILTNGFSKETNSFVKYYGSKDIDVSLLTLPFYDFINADDPRFLSTLKRIEKRITSFLWTSP